MEATLNLNAMNQTPNPWHVSFSYAHALQNTVLKTWQGLRENVIVFICVPEFSGWCTLCTSKIETSKMHAEVT